MPFSIEQHNAADAFSARNDKAQGPATFLLKGDFVILANVDRLQFARQLCSDKRVLDIGGSRFNHDGDSAFDKAYRSIEAFSRSYTIVDQHSSADIVCDLSDVDAVRSLILPDADVILCMETLEHLKNPGVVCDVISTQILRGAVAYLTLPRQSVFYRHLEKHGLKPWWGKCEHLYAFHRNHLDVFLRYNFRGMTTSVHACIGMYDMTWPLVWAATLGRGLSWGVKIQK